MPGDHLTELETSWTTIRNAHTPGPVGQAAMGELIGRYHDAVERYLRLKLRDPNLADEVFQEFWTKLLTHKLAGADQQQGAVPRLPADRPPPADHRPLPRPEAPAPPPGDLLDPIEPDADFDRVWREAVIKRVWSRLETYEVEHPQEPLRHRPPPPASTTPRRRSRSSPRSSASRLGATVTPEAFRKTLQRARAKFLELLIQELRETIHPAEPEDIEAEIFDLGLGHLYRRYSADRRRLSRSAPTPRRSPRSLARYLDLAFTQSVDFRDCENSHGPLTPGCRRLKL